MTETPLVVSAAMLALVLLEAIKYVVRRFVLKNPDYEFAPVFFELMVPFLTALSGLSLSYLGWGPSVELEPSVAIQWAVAIVIEYIFYHMGVQKAKEYRAAFSAK